MLQIGSRSPAKALQIPGQEAGPTLQKAATLASCPKYKLREHDRVGDEVLRSFVPQDPLNKGSPTHFPDRKRPRSGLPRDQKDTNPATNPTNPTAELATKKANPPTNHLPNPPQKSPTCLVIPASKKPFQSNSRPKSGPIPPRILPVILLGSNKKGTATTKSWPQIKAPMRQIFRPNLRKRSKFRLQKRFNPPQSAPNSSRRLRSPIKKRTF
jgi:hypothetical protein